MAYDNDRSDDAWGWPVMLLLLVLAVAYDDRPDDTWGWFVVLALLLILIGAVAAAGDFVCYRQQIQRTEALRRHARLGAAIRR
jgi:hypothetical protein